MRSIDAKNFNMKPLKKLKYKIALNVNRRTKHIRERDKDKE